jgi:MFS family permease
MRIWKPAAAPWPVPARSCASICRVPPQGTGSRPKTFSKQTFSKQTFSKQTFPHIGATAVPSANRKNTMDVVASHHRSRLRAAAGRYRDARRSLHAPASVQSRRGLDWMNFFIADVQTGFGTFVAFYLAQLGWSQGSIGLALAAGGLAGMLSQIPGGALADAVTWKRGLAALGIVMTGAAALILAYAPDFYSVLFAQILQGATAGIITPAIGAISLGLVGRSAMAVRTGRNYRYAAGGHALTAALMGAVGAYVAKSAIFVAAAALCVPALIALSFIRSDEIDYARARNAKSVEHAGGKHAASATRILDLCKNRKLALFIAATVLFQLADASMLPLIGENLAISLGPTRRCGCRA